MPVFAKVQSFLRNLFSARSVDSDLDQEVYSHLAMLTEENLRAGMPADEAQRTARIELGGIEQLKEQVREQRLGNWLQSVFSDCRFALRQLRKSPGFTFIAVLTLALGIGANTALYTVVESVLLRPLSYPHSDRLVFIAPKTDKAEFATTSWLNYRDISEPSRSFAAVGLYANDVTVVETKQGSISVNAPRVTPNLFSMLGVQPLMGRTFTDAEGQPGGAPVVLLAEGLWRESFGADPRIIGNTVRMGGVTRTVVGIMPLTMRFPEETGPDIQKAVWLPVQPTSEMQKERGYSLFSIVGQLRPGVRLPQAQAELYTIAQRILHDAGDTANPDFGFRATRYQDLLTASVRPVLLALLGALGLVLLIACANVANLLIARCMGRQQEFAVRAALGAGRSRLIRQLIAEGAVLSLLGCSVGLLLAQLALEGIHKLPEGTIPRGESISMHWTLILAVAVIATLTTLFSSLLPAFLVARTDPQLGLQSSRSIGTRSVRGYIAGLLVAVEVALSTVLLIGTGLLFHTLWNLQHAPLGFAVTRVTTFTAMPEDAAGFSGMAVSEDTTSAPASVGTLIYAPVLERMRHLPGVESAALITMPPLSGMDMNSDFNIVGQPKDPKVKQRTRVTAVSGQYALTLGTAIVRGRMVDDDDVAQAPNVAVINESLAKKYFANKNPLQQQLVVGGKETGMEKPFTIVGVLGDQVDSSVGGASEPMVFLPYLQVPTTSLFYQALLQTLVSFVVKTHGDLPVASAMRSVFHEAAPGFALDSFKTMQEAVDESMFSQRLGLYLTGAFAGLAVLMVMAGLYGVLAQLVSYRRHEIGIRMALGATRQRVASMILRQGAILIALGLGAGIVLALATSQLVRSFLYHVQTTDVLTYVAVSLSLLAVGLFASLLPARKAASIEPMQALRED
ncbi:MAG: ABC transporter permease [Candidatus Acidiferrum sp.]|jgi:putative ABC transport system permease protein